MLKLKASKDPRAVRAAEGMTDCKGVDMDNPTSSRVNYEAYLKSYAWKRKKRDWLVNFGLGASCFVCDKWMPPNSEGFNFHHRTYENLGDEKMTDLVLLCREHHYQLEVEFRLRRIHKRRRNEPDETLWDWTYYFIWHERQMLGKKSLEKTAYIKHLPLRNNNDRN